MITTITFAITFLLLGLSAFYLSCWVSSTQGSVRRNRAHQRFGAMGEAEDAAEYAASWFMSLVEFFQVTAKRGERSIFSVYF